jgi:AcrR family transcriptional regulator
MPTQQAPDVDPAARPPSRRPGRAGGKRDTNRRERTDSLYKAALTLFLERGIENVTVDEIAKAAGTAKGNFYRYATDKRELVEALMSPVATGFDSAFSKCEESLARATSAGQLTASFMGLALELFDIVKHHPDVVRLWLQESRAPGVGARAPIATFEHRLTARTVELTTVAHRHGLLKKIPPTVSALAVVGAVERLLIAHLRDNAFPNPADVVRHLVQLVMEGITG